MGERMAELPRFPAGFVFGTATASYQVEGAAGEDGRGTSIWDTFSHTPGRIADGGTGDVACDHYHRYAEDVALMADLGAGAYRFSVAWPRVQPDGRGPANERGLDFYRRLLDELERRGIAACLTLYHWDLPQALEDRGGWLSRETALRFADYVAVVGAALGDRVAMWAPINEPFVHWAEGYALGTQAPGRTMLFDAFPAAHHLLLGHGLAVAQLRSIGLKDASIGIVHPATSVRAASEGDADRAAAATYDLVRNRLFADPILVGRYPDALSAAFPGMDLSVIRDGDLELIAAPIDFCGVNYYAPEGVAADPDGPLGFAPVDLAGLPHTGFGWPIDPQGLREVLGDLRDRYGAALPPVYITENGAAFADALDERGEVIDTDRIAYLDGHLRAVLGAIEAGVDVRGYFLWSLLDNFEWAAGYSQRFGVVYVDFATQRRVPKASFRWYRDVIRARE